MKPIRRIPALAAALILTLTGCSDAPKRAVLPTEPLTVDLDPEAEENCITPPFWVVEDEQTGAQIFLLGSMHAGKPGVKYPQYVIDALLNSQWAAPEMDTEAFDRDRALQKRCVQYITLNGENTSHYIGESYQNTLEFFQDKGIYQPGMDSMIPFYWASAANSLVIQQSGLDTDLGTENILLDIIKSSGIEIREIEGAESQYRMMGELPMSVQLETLAQVVGDENIKAQAEAASELYEAWSAFDGEYLKGLTVYDPDIVSNPEDWQTYYDMMYTDRQKQMTSFITEALESGELGFVFVGTLHYYAEPSIITMLEQAGYTVSMICPEKTAEAETSPAA